MALGKRQTKDKFRYFESLCNLGQRPGDCKIDEDKEFSGCKNILLLFSDMNFESFKICDSFWNEHDQIYYNEAFMRRDVMRVFGQSKVGDENID